MMTDEIVNRVMRLVMQGLAEHEDQDLTDRVSLESFTSALRERLNDYVILAKKDAHLSQPQPVAQGEAVAWMWERRYSNGGYSKVTFSDEQSAREYAKDGESLTSPDLVYPLYAPTTIPTGRRVVPDELVKAAAIECARRSYGYWKGDSTGGDSAMNYFDRNMALGGIAHNIEMMESAIRKHIAAAPDAGGV